MGRTYRGLNKKDKRKFKEFRKTRNGKRTTRLGQEIDVDSYTIIYIH